MITRHGFLAALLSLVVSCSAEPIDWTPPGTNGMRDLSSFLEAHRKKLELPALAAAVVHRESIVAAGAVGERKYDSGVPVMLNDPFHIGSCTKSMTALLAAELVRDGKISFRTRVSEVFPEWNLEPEKGDITLEQLLQNRSGLPGQAPEKIWRRAFHDLQGEPPDQRKEFLREILAGPLKAPPGTQYIYSNLGFALAGAMLEQKAGKSWEQLMEERIFKPLALTTAGFGPPSHGEKIDAPWGHQIRDGAITPRPPGDNPVAIAPAGLVHMSILDIARYAAFHSDVFNGKVPELAALKGQLYTPPEGSDYAFGWIVQKRTWAGGTILTHAGSNTMFYTVIWIAPLKDAAFVVATNIGEREGHSIEQKCDQVVAALIQEFGP